MDVMPSFRRLARYRADRVAITRANRPCLPDKAELYAFSSCFVRGTASPSLVDLTISAKITMNPLRHSQT